MNTLYPKNKVLGEKSKNVFIKEYEIIHKEEIEKFIKLIKMFLSINDIIISVYDSDDDLDDDSDDDDEKGLYKTFSLSFSKNEDYNIDINIMKNYIEIYYSFENQKFESTSQTIFSTIFYETFKNDILAKYHIQESKRNNEIYNQIFNLDIFRTEKISNFLKNN